jgi:invasion protein IalB
MLKSTLWAAISLLFGFGGLALAQDTKVDAMPLDGASSLSETHGDWVINCEVIKNAKQCRMSQQQFSSENNNQRLLAVEFLAEENGVLNGTLAMPFGLALANAVTLSVDGATVGQPVPFSTCYMVGCVVPLKLDSVASNQLQTGTALGLAAVAVESQKPVSFKISLKGFASAHGRLQKLAAP